MEFVCSAHQLPREVWQGYDKFLPLFWHIVWSWQNLTWYPHKYSSPNGEGLANGIAKAKFVRYKLMATLTSLTFSAYVQADAFLPCLSHPGPAAATFYVGHGGKKGAQGSQEKSYCQVHVHVMAVHV